MTYVALQAMQQRDCHVPLADTVIDVVRGGE